MIWLWMAVAHAESAWVLGQGEGVVYGGAGLSTFHYGASGNLRDRQLRFRGDTYMAWGLGRSVQISLDAPLVHNRVVDHVDHPPRPCSTDFCSNVTTIGESGLHLRWGVLGGQTRLVLGAGVRTDAWNAGTRGRWANAGFGGTSVLGEVVVARDLGPIELLGRGYYSLAIQPNPWPLDHTGGLVQLGAWTGPVHVEAFGTFHTRLGGVEYGDGWADGTPDEWIWATLNYREVQAGGKLSIPLGEQAGLHVSAQRVLWQQNGPKDTWSGAIGVHRMLGKATAPPDAELVRWKDADLETVAGDLYDLEQTRSVGKLVIQVDERNGERLLDAEAWVYDTPSTTPAIQVLAQVSKNFPPIAGVEVHRFELDLHTVTLDIDFPNDEALLLTVGPLRYALPDAEEVSRETLDDGTLRVRVTASRP
ncbi:MAG: hypothetical protein GY913_09740 [Proteobacteria bacterium]|nr:hypothetical protein [Pseudomonadota bacterium]MCP4917193.1 hypothetical protein [Pseudomonadota bacterium]